MGFTRTYSQDVLFGPRSFGGIGCIDLRIEAGLAAIETIVRNLRIPGKGQSIMMHMLETWQHASGMTKPLLQYPQQQAPHLKGDFYNHVRAFLAKHNMSFEM